MFKLWPTRQQAVKKAKNDEAVVDLDAIVSEVIPFRFNGEIHELKPIGLDEFLKFANARAALEKSLMSSEKSEVDSLVHRYHSVISSVCSTITEEHIRVMSQVQIAALYQLVIDHITGQVDDGTGKKKRLKVPLYESGLPLSSQSVPESSGGH